MINYSEAEMVNSIYHQYVNNDDYSMVVLEVPFMSRCIDMVIVTNDDKIITIEFKLKNWKKAIEQAKNHKLGSDQSYICIPRRNITDTLKDAISDAGIGLFLYDNDSNNMMLQFMEAPTSTECTLPLKEMLNNTINQIAADTIT